MIKLFSLELKNDDPLALASKVRSIMHDIKNTGVEVDIPLIAYNKTFYPTYSHYLESLQASGNPMNISFDSLKKKKIKNERRLLETFVYQGNARGSSSRYRKVRRITI